MNPKFLENDLSDGHFVILILPANLFCEVNSKIFRLGN